MSGLTSRTPDLHAIDRRKLGLPLALLVLLLQAALLVTFALDPSEPPRHAPLLQSLWALAHKPSFYPLVLLGAAGPAATWMGLSVPGRHRWLLLLSWAVFLPLVIHWHGHRVWVMFQVLWRHGGG